MNALETKEPAALEARTGSKEATQGRNCRPDNSLRVLAFQAKTVAAAGVTDAVKLVKFARNALGTAVYRLDDDGFHCEALDDLHADSASLLASWAGRPVPQHPDYIAKAARAWRRQHGRSY